ncbi:extender of the chronological lifespan protein ecl2 [Gigaspora margarita]|uniref:Extender of the chronological lifespan protein ecl2 n=2 Tax=Gigaspora margarita TaxID=4874 RepID=A0A8H4ETC3_GIGMA|nr:extender of the chronological lifespan protein ecl2 [Gigaspora margarita]
MDLDWCLICDQKTQGALYCSEECRFKDHLSAYDYLTPSTSPLSSGSSTPTKSSSTGTSTTSINGLYLFYRKPSPAFQIPVYHESTVCALPLSSPVMKKQSTSKRHSFNMIEISSVKTTNVANMACSLDTHRHI